MSWPALTAKPDPATQRQLDRIEGALFLISGRLKTMAVDWTQVLADINAEKAAIAALADAVTSATNELTALSAALTAALAGISDPAIQAQIANIATQLEGNTALIAGAASSLNTAVAANPVPPVA